MINWTILKSKTSLFFKVYHEYSRKVSHTVKEGICRKYIQQGACILSNKEKSKQPTTIKKQET